MGEEVRLARGTIYLLLSQAFFVFALFILHATLARVFTPGEYGLFSVVMAILTWVEITVNTGIPSAVQKYLAEDTRIFPSIEGLTLRLQGLNGGLIFLLLLLLAPFAAFLFRDDRLGFYLRVAALDIPVLALYALFRGFLNGFQAFGRQAATVIAYSLTRVGAILILVSLGFALVGAFLGNALASLVALLVAFALSRPLRGLSGSLSPVGRERKAMSNRRLLEFAMPVILFTLSSHLLTNIDLYAVKALLGDAATVGFYAAAVNLANAPRFVFLAFSFTLLPALSESIAAGDRARVRRVLGQATRFLLLILFPLASLVAATSRELVALIYSQTYLPAASALNILIFSAAFYSIFMMLMTSILADDRPLLAFGVGLSLLPLALLANWRLITLLGTIGAASASALTTLIGLMAAATYVVQRFGIALSGRSVLKIATASLAIYILAIQYSVSGVLLLLNYAFLLALYLVLLYLLGEVGVEDWRKVKSLFPLPRKGFEVRRE